MVAELDPASGTRRSSVTRTDAPLHDAPTVAAGRVYAFIDVNDEMLKLRCLERRPRTGPTRP